MHIFKIFQSFLNCGSSRSSLSFCRSSLLKSIWFICFLSEVLSKDKFFQLSDSPLSELFNMISAKYIFDDFVFF